MKKYSVEWTIENLWVRKDIIILFLPALGYSRDPKNRHVEHNIFFSWFIFGLCFTIRVSNSEENE